MARTLLATTHFLNTKIRIYTDSKLQSVWAQATKNNIVVSSAWLRKRASFQAKILLHELVHVVEMNSTHEQLSPTLVECCTALAVTMEKKLTPLLLNLEFRGGVANPFLAVGRP